MIKEGEGSVDPFPLFWVYKKKGVGGKYSDQEVSRKSESREMSPLDREFSVDGFLCLRTRTLPFVIKLLLPQCQHFSVGIWYSEYTR